MAKRRTAKDVWAEIAVLRRKLRELQSEAERLDGEEEHARDPHCTCGHPESEHDEEGERECRYFDLSGDCPCDEYRRSEVALPKRRDDRR